MNAITEHVKWDRGNVLLISYFIILDADSEHIFTVTKNTVVNSVNKYITVRHRSH